MSFLMGNSSADGTGSWPEWGCSSSPVTRWNRWGNSEKWWCQQKAVSRRNKWLLVNTLEQRTHAVTLWKLSWNPKDSHGTWTIATSLINVSGNWIFAVLFPQHTALQTVGTDTPSVLKHFYTAYSVTKPLFVSWWLCRMLSSRVEFMCFPLS